MTHFAAIPTLETERLIMRGFREEDHPELYEIESDEEMTRFTGGVHNEDQAWRYMAVMIAHWTLRGFGPFALEEKSTGALVGYCGPWATPKFLEPEICYTLSRKFQGKGYATEALKAALHFVYFDLGWKTAMSCIDRDNHASQAVSQKMGAVKEQTDVPLGEFTVDIWRHLPPQTFKELHLKENNNGN